MNHRLIFCLLIFMVTIPGLVHAQQPGNDTTSYVSHIYQVEKKKEKVSDIARKLKVDASLISAMNDTLSVDSILIKGQKIRVPVYYDNAATKSNRDGKRKDEAKSRKGINTKAKAAEAKKSVAETPAPPAAPVDTELIQNRILLTDATLELNQALLQGVQASLDSLNVTDKKVVDEKNIQATIHSMQRQRDKALLTPFLLHMQDSLTTEIKSEENEKVTLEKMLGINSTKPVTADTVVPQKSTSQNKAATYAKDIDTSRVTTSELTAPVPTKKHIPKTEPVAVANNNPGMVSGSNGIAISVPATPRHWETAKALYYKDDNPDEGQVGTDADGVELIRGNIDSNAYVPRANRSVESTMSDTVRYIRAQLFFTKAMKATNEKNYKTAVESLKKAIDLLPRFYNAWFALGDADAHLGLYTKALNEYKTCTTIDSSQADLYYKMANMQLKLKQKADANALFNKSLKLDSNYIPSIMGLASINMEKKRYKTAIKQYTHVLEIDWGYHSAYRHRALAEYWLKNYDAAIDDFTRYIIFDESDASVYYFRGMAKIASDQKGDGCTDISISAKLGYSDAFKEMEGNCK